MEEVPINCLLSIFSGVELHLFNADILLSLFAIVLLLISSAFISGSEVAYFSLTSAELAEIDNNNGSVYGIYTNYSVVLDPNEDPSVHLYENGMNCEHLWPQSLGAGQDPAKSDMHHLRPCKENVNSSRGNKPFNDIIDSQTNTWFWLNYQSGSIPQNNIDEYSESGSNSFEPREDVKGDIARSMFYFHVMYSDIADQPFFEGQKNILKDWHYQDIAD